MSELMLNLLSRSNGPFVRGMVAPNGMHEYSVYDTITIACAYKDTGASARKEYIRLTSDGSEYKDEVVASCRYLKFPGKGQRDTPCMTIRGLQRLLMILGGKVAAKFREIIEGTFTRVMAGDQSLIEVINANAVSDAPIQQAYRAALAQEPVAPVLDELCLGKKRERDDVLFDLEIAERKLLHATKLIEHANNAMRAINELKAWVNVDERTKLQTEDYIKNVLFNTMAVIPTGTLAISDGAQSSGVASAPINMAPINISIVAREMGLKLTDAQIQRAGREMAKHYRATYNSDPQKHKQYVSGNYIAVNSYMERDRAMMEKAIRAGSM